MRSRSATSRRTAGKCYSDGRSSRSRDARSRKSQRRNASRESRAQAPINLLIRNNQYDGNTFRSSTMMYNTQQQRHDRELGGVQKQISWQNYGTRDAVPCLSEQKFATPGKGGARSAAGKGKAQSQNHSVSKYRQRRAAGNAEAGVAGLDQLITRHEESENKRLALHLLQPGMSYQQARQYFGGARNSLQAQ